LARARRLAGDVVRASAFAKNLIGGRWPVAGGRWPVVGRRFLSDGPSGPIVCQPVLPAFWTLLGAYRIAGRFFRTIPVVARRIAMVAVA